MSEAVSAPGSLTTATEPATTSMATGAADKRRAALHRALDQLLDARPGGPEAGSWAEPTGAELTEAVTAWRLLGTAVDDALTSVIPRWEDSADWASDGDATPASWLVAHLGLGQTAARALRRTALLARPMTHVHAALDRGTVPATHLHHLVRARTPEVAELFDRDEAALVAAAETLPYDAFTVHLATWRLAALEELARNEPDRPPAPLTESDRLSVSRSFGGRGLLSGELSPESLAVLSGALDTEIDEWHRSGRLAERATASRGELQAEALLEIVRRGVRPGSLAGAPRPLLIGLADLDTLLGRAAAVGLPAEAVHARRAEILGTGPVDDAAIQRLLCSADLSLVITHRGQPLWVGRAHRRATAAQLRALITASGGTCEWPGCTAPHRHCDAHHLTPWSSGGPTDLSNLALVCHHHHRVIHQDGFQVRRGADGLQILTRQGDSVRPALPRRVPAPPGPPASDTSSEPPSRSLRKPVAA